MRDAIYIRRFFAWRPCLLVLILTQFKLFNLVFKELKSCSAGNLVQLEIFSIIVIHPLKIMF